MMNYSTLCGTPNYIAPEVLSKKGHSYEVDIWSIGCILYVDPYNITSTWHCIYMILSLTLCRYTLLVGKPPFETESLKDTYQRIKRNEYRIPSHISPSARSLITRLLRADPATRPTPQDILQDPFLTAGFIPARLPHR
jgi:polo-like kinase 1